MKDKKNDDIPKREYNKEFLKRINRGNVEFSEEHDEDIEAAEFRKDMLKGHKDINNNSSFNRNMPNTNTEFGLDNDFCEDCDGCK